MNLIFADLEADNLLPDCTKIHVAVFSRGTYTHTCTEYDLIAEYFENPNNTLVMHNGLSFDKRVVEKLLGIKVRAKIIDTMFLSWYLYPKAHVHGLAAWGDKLGIEKPQVDDWDNADIEVYIHRCQTDVRIQEKLWNRLWDDLLDLYETEERAWHAVNHINFKGQCAALQEESGWKLDVPKCTQLLQELTDKYDLAVQELSAVMPRVKVRQVKKQPKKLYRADGDLSALGQRWVIEVSKVFPNLSMSEAAAFNKPITVIKGYNDPNPGSTSQMKKWLYSLGWRPTSFKYVREDDGVRKIEQIKDPNTNMLCQSVEALIEEKPELVHLREMSIIKHRIGICKGFLKHVDREGLVHAEVQGFTNTLRFKHRVCVNIPGNGKAYGTEIRGLLTAKDDEHELCGADMSSLEDRTKQHYMYQFDPEYVEEMSTPDFDPHLDIAVQAGMILSSEAEDYKNGHGSKEFRATVKAARSKAKVANYAATYGAGPETIARGAGISIEDARELHDAYWSRNEAINMVAASLTTKTSRKLWWVWNPVSKMWLWLKHDKDRFSTLNQSTGTYCFDRWLWWVLKDRRQLTAQFHDEGVWELKRGYRDDMTAILKYAVSAVNKELRLNRDLDCDVQFANDYSGVH